MKENDLQKQKKQREKLINQLRATDDKIKIAEAQKQAKEEKVRFDKESADQLTREKELEHLQRNGMPLSDFGFVKPMQEEIPKIKFSDLSGWTRLWIYLGVLGFIAILGLVGLVVFLLTKVGI